MLDWIKKHMDDEDRFGAGVTTALHLILLIIALLYTVDFKTDARASFIAITLGEFRSGTDAQLAEVQPEETATRPNPVETEPEDPDPEVIQPVEETPQEQIEEPARPVELPEQTEEIEDDEVIETPETEIIDPEIPEIPEEEVVVEEAPPVAQADEEVQEGTEEGGDERGDEGAVDVDEGTGNHEDRSAPYSLEGFEGRDLTMQPLPENRTNMEATITMRIIVNPDGSVRQLIPVRRSGNPELETEVMRVLRGWRFSSLPSGVPQEVQQGLITFRFVLD